MGSLTSSLPPQQLLGLPASKMLPPPIALQAKAGLSGIILSQSLQLPALSPGLPMSLRVKCEVLTRGL